MPKSSDTETYLRLACERTLLSGRTSGRQDGAEAAVISRSCVAAGFLEPATASAVLDEYAFAMSLRDQHRGHMRMYRQSLAPTKGQRLSAHRVAFSTREFQHGDQQWTLERALFADDATHLDISGTDPAGNKESSRRRRGGIRLAPGMHSQPHPQVLALEDDQGTKATGHSGAAGWGGGTWHGSYTTDVPLSQDTRWIEVDGTRIDLPEWCPAPEVHLEETVPMDPLRAMFYREILSTDRRHGGEDTVEIACRALLAIGALEEDAPLLLEIRRIAAAVAGAAPVPGLVEPWASLLARLSKEDGPNGKMAIGAVIEDLEGFSIRFEALISEPTSFSVSLAISPGTPLLHFPGVDLEPSPIIWWAEDDRQNSYVAFSDQGGGRGDLAEGHVTSLAPLDPKATELRLLPTAAHTRAAINVPLAGLAEQT